MKIDLDSSDREFLDQLHRLESGTIHDLCERLGVTATAVRQRLARLQRVGLVSREAIRSGRGRPHHAYRLTEAGRRELGENYSELAMILWREVCGIEEVDVRSRVIGRIRNALVSQLGAPVQAQELPERVEELSRALSDRGFDVESDIRGALPILRENNCPYLELASSDPSICELEQSVFGAILGTRIRLSRCCLDGHSCCEFEPESGEPAAYEPAAAG